MVSAWLENFIERDVVHAISMNENNLDGGDL
jgi:hypothetical protein